MAGSRNPIIRILDVSQSGIGSVKGWIDRNINPNATDADRLAGGISYGATVITIANQVKVLAENPHIKP